MSILPRFGLRLLFNGCLHCPSVSLDALFLPRSISSLVLPSNIAGPMPRPLIPSTSPTDDLSVFWQSRRQRYYFFSSPAPNLSPYQYVPRAHVSLSVYSRQLLLKLSLPIFSLASFLDKSLRHTFSPLDISDIYCHDKRPSLSPKSLSSHCLCQLPTSPLPLL